MPVIIRIAATLARQWWDEYCNTPGAYAVFTVNARGGLQSVDTNETPRPATGFERARCAVFGEVEAWVDLQTLRDYAPELAELLIQAPGPV